MQIFLSRGGKKIGPYSLEQINHQLAIGELSAVDLGWSESSPGWKPIVSFTGIIVPGGASSTPVSINIATPMTWGLPEYAGFWIRAGALAIDLFVLSIFALTIATIFRRSPAEAMTPSAAGAILQALVLLLYMPALWASRMQATVGQRICRLRLVDGPTGSRVSLGRGFLRLGGMFISGLLLGIGFFMAAFTERKRALHDMIADTCIVKDSPVDRWLTAARHNLGE
jgi:uncharacterized RDD family membrane protein YckC